MFSLNNLSDVYFIAEIGINHNGDLSIAKRLIDAAFACGWDCVKFQKREPDVCVPDAQKERMVDTPWGSMTYLAYKKRIEFGAVEYDFIDKYCAMKTIFWTASVWDPGSLDFLIKYRPPFIKIPSAHLTNTLLLEKAAQARIPLIVSTGMSTLEEVDVCVEILRKNKTEFALMHTNSAYPAPDDEINLRVINTLRKRYGCTIGYSGHEYGLEASILAVSLGATIIERHITLDHMMWGTDQKASLEIQGMDKLIRRAKAVKMYMGSSEKVLTKSEISPREKLRGENANIVR